MNRNNAAYEYKRLNGPSHKQSYVDYIAFLLPKIWEIPNVRLSPYVRNLMARREILSLTGDIRETQARINKLQTRFKFLQNKSFEGVLFKDEKDELMRIKSVIRKQTEWLEELKGFKTTLETHFPEQGKK